MKLFLFVCIISFTNTTTWRTKLNSGSGGVAGVRPFPEYIVEQLKGLYEAGMVATGRDYSTLHQLAYSRTGLSAGQVKVRIMHWLFCLQLSNALYRTGLKGRTWSEKPLQSVRNLLCECLYSGKKAAASYNLASASKEIRQN